MRALLIAAAALAQDATPVLPDPILDDPAATYRLCLDTARSYPEQGFELAGKWAGLGGGEPAKHCRAVALISLKEYAEAATSLEELAKASKRPERLRAGMLAQAGQAWMLGEDLTRAYAALTAALELVPKDVDLLIDRAGVLADSGQFWEAIDDLNLALEQSPNSADALTFRASAYRLVDAAELAFEDAEKALSIHPRHTGALLERAMLNRAAERREDARKDLIRILELAPQSGEADTARKILEAMDVKPG